MEQTFEIAPNMADVTLWRTARVEHRCAGRTYVAGRAQRNTDGKFIRCGKPIPAGSRYVEYLGETPAYESGVRYHVECAEREGLVCRSALSQAQEGS